MVAPAKSGAVPKTGLGLTTKSFCWGCWFSQKKKNIKCVCFAALRWRGEEKKKKTDGFRDVGCYGNAAAVAEGAEMMDVWRGALVVSP